MSTNPTRSNIPPLCVADETTFWPWQRWPQFATRPERAAHVVVVPIVGMADWGLGHPLDAEETVLMHVLKEASAKRTDRLQLLVVPPVRFVLGADEGCAFAVDPPVAHACIEEVVTSVAAAGFRKIVLFNSSPWNEELCDVAARDLRIDRGLQMFCIHLAALGLDFLPGRNPNRWELQTVITALLGAAPERIETAEDVAGGGKRSRTGGGKPATVTAATTAAPGLLETAAKRLGGLLREIHARAPLPDQGRIPEATP
jgi:creatinine amidohydrolase